MGLGPSVKVYVDVEAHFDKDGTLLPWEITWENGEKYPIDRLTSIQKPRASKDGSEEACYTIVVRGQKSRLFFERSIEQGEKGVGRWYVKRRDVTH